MTSQSHISASATGPSFKEIIDELRRSGCYLSTARRLNIERADVLRAIFSTESRQKKFGPTLPKSIYKYAKHREHVLKLIQELPTYSAVGQKLGISRQAVEQMSKHPQIHERCLQAQQQWRERKQAELLDWRQRVQDIADEEASWSAVARRMGILQTGLSHKLQALERHGIELPQLGMEVVTKYDQFLEWLAQQPADEILPTVNEIAEELASPVTSIYVWLRDARNEGHHVPELPPSVYEKRDYMIIERIKEGCTTLELERIPTVSRYSIRRILKKYKLPPYPAKLRPNQARLYQRLLKGELTELDGLIRSQQHSIIDVCRLAIQHGWEHNEVMEQLAEQEVPAARPTGYMAVSKARYREVLNQALRQRQDRDWIASELGISLMALKKAFPWLGIDTTRTHLSRCQRKTLALYREHRKWFQRTFGPAGTTPPKGAWRMVSKQTGAPPCAAQVLVELHGDTFPRSLSELKAPVLRPDERINKLLDRGLTVEQICEKYDWTASMVKQIGGVAS